MRIHKAWIMMGACCVLMMSLALHTTCLSLFTQPVTDSLLFPRSVFTVYISIAGIMTALSLPVWGRLLPKIGIKRIIAIGGIITSVCFILMSWSDSLWQFYLLGVIFGFCTPSVNSFPTAVVINSWFIDKKGLAMGIAMAFSGVGSAVFSPVLSSTIASHGWQSGYLVVGISTLILTVPIGLFLIKARPQGESEKPYGSLPDDAKVSGQAVNVPLGGVSFHRAVRSFAFYCVLLSQFIGALTLNGILQHIPAHIVNRGLPIEQVGIAMSIFSVSMMVAKIGLGWLNDRIGTLKAVIVCYIVGVVGLILMLTIQGTSIPILTLIAMSCGIPVTTIWPAILASKMFGQRSYSEIYAFIQAVSVLGYALGTPLYGLSYDVTGSYSAMIIVSICLTPVAVILLIAGMRSSEKLSQEPEEPAS